VLTVVADEQRGGATGSEGDREHENTRGFHNASLTLVTGHVDRFRPHFVQLS
jgi:hypothetical protein